MTGGTAVNRRFDIIRKLVYREQELSNFLINAWKLVKGHYRTAKVENWLDKSKTGKKSKVHWNEENYHSFFIHSQNIAHKYFKKYFAWDRIIRFLKNLKAGG